VSAALAASPAALDAERALLGGLLLDDTQIDPIRQILPRPEAFFGGAHRRIYTWILSRGGESVDVISLSGHILRSGMVEEFGGISYATGLPEHCPSTENLVNYARLIRGAALSRSLMVLGAELRQRAMTNEPGLDLLAYAAGELDSLYDAESRTSSGWKHLNDVMMRLVERTQQIADGTTKAPVISTGYPALDTALGGGFAVGDGPIVIAARPGMGKTALMANLVEHMARAGNTAGIFSLEMRDLRLAERLWVGATGVFGTKIRTGKGLTNLDWEKLDDGHNSLHGLPIYIDDTPQLPVSQIRARARSLKRRDPSLRVIALDYVQIMGSEPGHRSREQEVAASISGLTAMGKELDVCVIVLAQLNRAVEQRSDKTPMPSDLRDSGTLEQEAHTIIFPFRPHVYSPERAADEAYAVIGKGRDGGTGQKPALRWDGDRTRFLARGSS